MEDKQKILTNKDKNDIQTKINEQKIQEELYNEISTKDLEISNNNDQINVVQLTYYTKNNDKSLEYLSKTSGKKIQKEENKENIPKIKKLITDELNSQKTKKIKLENSFEDNVKSIISQDISSIFAIDQNNEDKIKNQNEIEKQNYIQRAKNTKQEHNQKEMEMMQKSGINPKDFGGKVTREETKVGLWDNILKFGSVETSAKGLNNAKYGLLIYANKNTGLSLNADTPNDWQQLNLRTTQGYTGKQRWCFDNNSNKIYLDTVGICNGWGGKKCIHALGGSNYGDSIDLYDCNYNYGNDAGQK